MQKLAPLLALSLEGRPVTIPKSSRLLRFAALPEHRQLGVETGCSDLKFEVVFGIAWECESFIAQACKVGHPLDFESNIPADLKFAIQANVEWPAEKLANWRIEWCRKWTRRAAELRVAEEADRRNRADHVKQATACKRLLLTQEMPESINYEDIECLGLLREGSTLAGDVIASRVFSDQYKPCLTTLSQLQEGAPIKNEMVLALTRSSGNAELDSAVLAETRKEVSCGWADGSWPLQSLEKGAAILSVFL